MGALRGRTSWSSCRSLARGTKATSPSTGSALAWRVLVNSLSATKASTSAETTRVRSSTPRASGQRKTALDDMTAAASFDGGAVTYVNGFGPISTALLKPRLSSFATNGDDANPTCSSAT